MSSNALNWTTTWTWKTNKQRKKQKLLCLWRALVACQQTFFSLFSSKLHAQEQWGGSCKEHRWSSPESPSFSFTYKFSEKKWGEKKLRLWVVFIFWISENRMVHTLGKSLVIKRVLGSTANEPSLVRRGSRRRMDFGPLVVYRVRWLLHALDLPWSILSRLQRSPQSHLQHSHNQADTGM